ncbi:MAG: hypothetical protein J6X51_00995, partial [Bacteroidales bacterium]|nr:hypothetical protein [Bacteroidales bacterium]
MLFLRHGRSSPLSPRRGETHAVQLTPYKRSAVWCCDPPGTAMLGKSSSTTSPSVACSARTHRHAPSRPSPTSTAMPPTPASG